MLITWDADWLATAEIFMALIRHTSYLVGIEGKLKTHWFGCNSLWYLVSELHKELTQKILTYEIYLMANCSVYAMSLYAVKIKSWLLMFWQYERAIQNVDLLGVSCEEDFALELNYWKVDNSHLAIGMDCLEWFDQPCSYYQLKQWVCDDRLQLPFAWMMGVNIKY